MAFISSSLVGALPDVDGKPLPIALVASLSLQLFVTDGKFTVLAAFPPVALIEESTSKLPLVIKLPLVT